jgi:L-amino acid N-acyltransferase YncA
MIEKMKKRAEKMFFKYVRLGKVQVVLSYRSGSSVENFDGLKVILKSRMYKDKSWTIKKLGSRLKSGNECFRF